MKHISYQEALAILKIKEKELDKLIDEGEIKARKKNGFIELDKKDIFNIDKELNPREESLKERVKEVKKYTHTQGLVRTELINYYNGFTSLDQATDNIIDICNNQEDHGPMIESISKKVLEGNKDIRFDSIKEFIKNQIITKTIGFVILFTILILLEKPLIVIISIAGIIYVVLSCWSLIKTLKKI